MDTKDTQQVERLEEIAARMLMFPSDLREILSDPAIPAHIPAYAALREDRDEWKQAADLWREDCRKAKRDLQSQLAALQGGVAFALKVHRGEICYKSTADDQSYGMWCPVTPDAEHGLTEGTEFYLHAQPAIAGKVPRNDDVDQLLHAVFQVCEATEEIEPKNDFERGRRFEAKHIRHGIGNWFQDTFCGRKFMGEPVLSKRKPDIAGINGVGRLGDYEKCAAVWLDHIPSDDELRQLHCMLATSPSAPIAEQVGLPIAQEPKYTTDGQSIINRASDEAIPHDEPVFIFRARDVHAREAIEAYACVLTPGDHRDAVVQRVADFATFASAFPDRMKEPDTATLKASAESGEIE